MAGGNDQGRTGSDHNEVGQQHGKGCISHEFVRCRLVVRDIKPRHEGRDASAWRRTLCSQMSREPTKPEETNTRWCEDDEEWVELLEEFNRY